MLMNRPWLVASAGLVIVAGLSRDLSAQEKWARAKLTANPFFISVDYGEQRIKGQAVILRGEPLDIVIGVSNDGPIGLLAAAVEPAWKDHVMVRRRTGGYRGPDAGTPLQMPIIFEFELRELVTEADQLDQMIHLAVRAIDEGRLPAAAKLLDSALALEPLSSLALILKGRLHVVSGACAAAAAAWQLAANVLENGTDSRRQPHPNEMDGVGHRRAAEYWREGAKGLRCE